LTNAQISCIVRPRYDKGLTEVRLQDRKEKFLMKTVGGGLDGGNTRCKGIVVRPGGKITEIAFPSVRTRGSLAAIANSRRSRGENRYSTDQECLDLEEYVIQLKGKDEHLYGSLALEEDAHASSGLGDPLRYSSERMEEMIAIVLGSCVPDEECEAYIAMGVPANMYNADQEKLIRKNLIKEIRCKLNGVDRCFIIRDIRVLREGAGASIVLAPPKDKRRGTGGIIDIGGYSTDLYGYNENLKVISALCGSVKVGVESIMDRVDEHYCKSYKLDEGLTSKQRHECLLAYAYPATSSYPTLTVRRTVVPTQHLRDWMRSAVIGVGEDVNLGIAEIWGTNSSGEIAVRFGNVDLIGGGAKIVEQEIAKRIEGAVAHERAYLQNALGYAKIAEYMLTEAKKASV
jgi:hypothetical protein